MVTKHGLAYKGFMLDCDPLKTSSGRFAATLKVRHGGVQVHGRDFPALDDFATEAEAVAHSRAYGERWVNENGSGHGTLDERIGDQPLLVEYEWSFEPGRLRWSARARVPGSPEVVHELESKHSKAGELATVSDAVISEARRALHWRRPRSARS